MTSHNCSRCDGSIDHPVEKNGDYIIADDFIETEKEEVFVAMVHTPETKQRVEEAMEHFPEREFTALAAEMAWEKAEEKRRSNVGRRKRVRRQQQLLDDDTITLSKDLREKLRSSDPVYLDETDELDEKDVAWAEEQHHKEVPFSIPSEKFDHVIVDSPLDHEGKETARVDTKEVERKVQKTALVCPKCVKDSDEVVWGPDG